jgi:hypothetical protein
MKVINLPEIQKVEVIAIVIRLRCKKCYSQYGVYLKENGSLPDGWELCLKCEGRKSLLYGNVKEQSNYGNTTIK